MLDMHRYFDGNHVNRETIAVDIREQRLSHEELMSIIADPRIYAEFYGDFYRDKVSKNQWDKNYLEKLSYSVISEGFNKDYLLYLEEVAGYVSGRKRNVKIATCIIIVVVAMTALMAGAAGLFSNSGQKDSMGRSYSECVYCCYCQFDAREYTNG